MISVVVPIYNVEEYLGECLDSLAAQSVGDLEVLMVDDGSTDGSAAIAADRAARDPRFRLLTQPNGGLGKARNTGIEHAQGEFLAFLDSDDKLPPNAYELLLGALQATGSDFATGNVHRLTRRGTWPAPFLRDAFARTRLRTHITRFRPLIADRPAWNKLWRRSFWGARRFPVGVAYEDAPVVIPAHFEARSVDVLSDPVYLYRIRQGSITHLRLHPEHLADRLAAIEGVSGWLRDHAPAGSERWYHEQVLRDELDLHLRQLDEADPEEVELFLNRVNPFLDRVDPQLLDRTWGLVRARRTSELVAAVRAAKRDSLKRQVSRRIPMRYRMGWRKAVGAVRKAVRGGSPISRRGSMR